MYLFKIIDCFRSLCTLVSKWTYQANAKTSGWDQDYFTQIGLEDLVFDKCAKIGNSLKQISLSVMEFMDVYIILTFDTLVCETIQIDVPTLIEIHHINYESSKCGR